MVDLNCQLVNQINQASILTEPVKLGACNLKFKDAKLRLIKVVLGCQEWKLP